MTKAVWLSETEIVKLLLNAGAAPNAKHSGDPVLHEAVRKEDLDIVRLLLEAGADPNGKNSHGETPLQAGPPWRDKMIIRKLEEAGGK